MACQDCKNYTVQAYNYKLPEVRPVAGKPRDAATLLSAKLSTITMQENFVHFIVR